MTEEQTPLRLAQAIVLDGKNGTLHILSRELISLARQLSNANDRIRDLEAHTNDRVRDLEAQHKDLVFRNHFLNHRPDLKPERLEAYTTFVKQVDALREEVAEYKALANRKDLS